MEGEGRNGKDRRKVKMGMNRIPGYLSKGRNTKRKIKGKGGKEGMRT